jgi:single-strand DNA-binding protein
MNKCIIVGFLGGEPELKSLTNNSVCNFNVATTEKWVSDGEKHERTEWHKIVVWGKMAEVCAKYLTKGSQVAIEGKLQTRSFEDKDGNKRYITEIVAEHVNFLDRKKTSDGGLPL